MYHQNNCQDMQLTNEFTDLLVKNAVELGHFLDQHAAHAAHRRGKGGSRGTHWERSP